METLENSTLSVENKTNDQPSILSYRAVNLLTQCYYFGLWRPHTVAITMRNTKRRLIARTVIAS